MRPPVIALIIDGTFPSNLYPGRLSKNKWHEKIRNVMYDDVRDKIIIDATDGVWDGDSKFNTPFKKNKFISQRIR